MIRKEQSPQNSVVRPQTTNISHPPTDVIHTPRFYRIRKVHPYFYVGVHCHHFITVYKKLTSYIVKPTWRPKTRLLIKKIDDFFFNQVIDWSIDWLVDQWSINLLIDLLINLLIDLLINWLIDWLIKVKSCTFTYIMSVCILSACSASHDF